MSPVHHLFSRLAPHFHAPAQTLVVTTDTMNIHVPGQTRLYLSCTTLSRETTPFIALNNRSVRSGSDLVAVADCCSVLKYREYKISYINRRTVWNANELYYLASLFRVLTKQKSGDVIEIETTDTLLIKCLTSVPDSNRWPSQNRGPGFCSTVLAFSSYASSFNWQY